MTRRSLSPLVIAAAALGLAGGLACGRPPKPVHTTPVPSASASASSVAVAPAPPPASAYAESSLSERRVQLDATILWDTQGHVPPITAPHVLVSGDLVFVGTGVGFVRALGLSSGALQRTYAGARLPLFRKDGRLLAVTDKGLSWFAIDTGAETELAASADAKACPAAVTPHCVFAARAELVEGAMLVAHKHVYCNWFDGGPVTESRYICQGDAQLLRVGDEGAAPAPDPVPAKDAKDVKAVRDPNQVYFEDAEAHLVFTAGAIALHYTSPKTKKQFRLSPRGDGPMQPSHDASVAMLSALETVPVNHAILRRWRMFDFRTTKLVDIEGLHAVPATPFIATRDVILVQQLDVEALNEPTLALFGYDRATGKRRWRQALERPPAPARPPPSDDPNRAAPP